MAFLTKTNKTHKILILFVCCFNISFIVSATFNSLHSSQSVVLLIRDTKTIVSLLTEQFIQLLPCNSDIWGYSVYIFSQNLLSKILIIELEGNFKFILSNVIITKNVIAVKDYEHSTRSNKISTSCKNFKCPEDHCFINVITTFRRGYK